MAVVDRGRDVLVIRIVYDGPAMSGKTTSLRALAEGWDIPITTPEERSGRTVFFDWVDYVGGLFEGRRIRCQLVSVPGQNELALRREHLLRQADAVVFVADTRRDHLAGGWSRFERLMSDVLQRTPRVGVVMQANKRDDPDAVPRDQVVDRAQQIAPVAVLESVATTGQGIREAFVFAVRLALDRVRELAARGELEFVEAPAENSAEDLLSALKVATGDLQFSGASETPFIPSADQVASELAQLDQLEHALEKDIARLLPTALAQPRVDHAAGTPDERPFIPDPTMPGGSIWPPVDGRALLHEVARLSLRPQRTGRGDWWASGSGWRIHSLSTAVYEDSEAARRALIGWSRTHAMSQDVLSRGRTVILADAGGGRMRLWQLVRVEDSLRERLATLDPSASAESVASEVLQVAEGLVQARAVFAEAGLELPCSLWTVGQGAHNLPSYVGLMPFLGQSWEPNPSDAALLAEEFEPVFADWKRDRYNLDEIFGVLKERARHRRTLRPSPVDDWIAARVGGLLGAPAIAESSVGAKNVVG